MGETQGFRRKRRKGTMRDDAVRVIAKDVFACWRENGGAMEASGEVGSEERPDSKRAEKRGAVGEVARVSGTREQDVYKVGDEDGPENWDGAKEKEGAEKQGNAESVPEDDESLQTSFEWN